MNNNLYIDDLNVLGRFGCRVTRGGYNDLLAFPAMKEPEKTIGLKRMASRWI